MSCPMAHQMGLAAMTLGTKSIPNIQYHNASGSLLSGNTDGNTVNVAAAGFTGTNLPFLSNTTYFAIINGSKTFTSSSPDGWTYSPIAAGGTIVTQTIYSKRTFKYKGWLYEYTGGIQSLSITQAGSYKLEVWGAQGGKASNLPTTYIAACKGGYSYGTKTMTNGNTLFICVGGVGGTATYGNTVPASGGAGGYNGGGAGGGSTTPTAAIGGGGGGGATHIATVSGTLYSLLNGVNSSSVLIVAGGGGGSTDHQVGGAGGGTTGGGTQSVYALGLGGNEGSNSVPILSGASSTFYYQKGQGEKGCDKTIFNGHGTSGCGGGGGGYYGGHAYQGGNGQYTDVAGAGGSGYIGGVTGGSTSNGVREGHGYARITTNFEWVF